MVEYARIFLALLWLTARMHVPTKVNAPKSATMVDMVVSAKAGAMRSSRYVPALTMVAECSRAETGVGATMAPHSQLSKGTCADLVKAARQKKANGSSMAVVFNACAPSREDRRFSRPWPSSCAIQLQWTVCQGSSE